MRLTGQLSLPAWLMHYFLIKVLKRSSRARKARSGAPWVRKFGNLCFHGERPYVRPLLHVSRDEILHFKHPLVSAVIA